MANGVLPKVERRGRPPHPLTRERDGWCSCRCHPVGARLACQTECALACDTCHPSHLAAVTSAQADGDDGRNAQPARLGSGWRNGR